MDNEQWAERCAVRLRRRWPSVDMIDLLETARQLADDERLREQVPEDAAAWWLRQGVAAS